MQLCFCLQIYKEGLIGRWNTVHFDDIPDRKNFPGASWMLRVYGLDVYQRFDELKAVLTSSTGRYLKMDSTKKVTLRYNLLYYEG